MPRKKIPKKHTFSLAQHWQILLHWHTKRGLNGENSQNFRTFHDIVVRGIFRGLFCERLYM